MPLNQPLIAELKHEGANTRKMLERVPAEHFDWQPHAKSMSLVKLASHVAEIPLWAEFTINMDELDLAAGNFIPFKATSVVALLQMHDENIAKAITALESATDEQLIKVWTLKRGDFQIMSMPKIQVLRSMVGNHLYHHRGQLSVYLRMLDVAIPGMYGPSADEKG